MTNSSTAIADIKLSQNYNDIFKKSVKVNGIYVKAYIDTGSQVNVLSTQVSQILALTPKTTSVKLKKFSGESIMSRGEVDFKLEIDDLAILHRSIHVV